MPLRWLFVDMNSFFASVEQQDRPELRDKPLIVVPVMTDSTCAIAASYPAKRFGIKTGTNVGEARQLCRNLLIVEARPPLYLDYHKRIKVAIEGCIHVDKTLSIDEVACRLPSNESSPERALNIAFQIKSAILRQIGSAVTCSIGIAPNCFLAKIASDMQKPDGLTVIRSEELPHKLFSLNLRDLPGVGRNMHIRLAAHGIDSVETLCKLPTDSLARAWGGIVGTHFYHHLRGDDLPDAPTKTRSIGHSNVLSPELRNPIGAHNVLIRLVHKAAARLRHEHYAAGHMSLSIQTVQHKYWGDHLAIPHRQDTLSLLEAMDHLWKRRPLVDPKKVGITLFDLKREESLTAPLFPEERLRLRLAKAMDLINDKFGKKTLYFADMHAAKDSAPMRLAFNYIPTDNW